MPTEQTPNDAIGKVRIDFDALQLLAEAAAAVTVLPSPLPRPDRQAWPNGQPILTRSQDGSTCQGLLPAQARLIEALQPNVLLALLTIARNSAAEAERMKTALRDALVSVAYLRSTLPVPTAVTFVED